MSARGAQAYKQVYLESASPTRLLDELYLRLLRDMDQARELIRARDPGGKGTAISHALAIVDELSLALDRQSAPELCSNLSRLYGFVSARLLAANLSMDEKPLAEAARVVETLRDAFLKASAQ